MADYTGWNYVNVVATNGNITTGSSSVTGATVTSPTQTLTTGETFDVGTKAFIYLGTGTTSGTSGFYAEASGKIYYFTNSPPPTQTTFLETSGVDYTLCFMQGTLIATPNGEVPVECLAAGDLVLTIDGDAKPLRWVGRQSVVTLFADPATRLPIRIKAGALAENTPTRDLLVSPAHALLLDGVLVEAAALVNGSSITRAPDLPERFAYYHLETQDHSIILAEGAAAETYIDNTPPAFFDNRDTIQPREEPMRELELPRARSQRQVPGALRTRLAQCAAALTTATSVAA